MGPIIDRVVSLLRDKLFLKGNGAMHVCDWPKPNIFIPLSHVVTVPMLVHIFKLTMEYPHMVIM